MSEFNDSSNIDCHLQNIGMGTLICRAAKQTGNGGTNEVTPEDCFECEAGKIYRELCCDSILPHIKVVGSFPNSSIYLDNLLCKIRKRFTTYEDCLKCNLRAAETTKELLNTVKGIFTDSEFYSSYKEIEKARTSIRDGKYDTALTNAISSAESTMRIIHQKTNSDLPKKPTITDLYKSSRGILKLDEIDEEKTIFQLVNNLAGLISSFANLRNSLSDAHGRDKPLDVKEYIAELAINVSSTISTFLVRRYNKITGEFNNE